jgi:hypothetical protein
LAVILSIALASYRSTKSNSSVGRAEFATNRPALTCSRVLRDLASALKEIFVTCRKGRVRPYWCRERRGDVRGWCGEGGVRGRCVEGGVRGWCERMVCERMVCERKV